MKKVRIAGLTKGSVVDGLGVRTVVFFQGCPRHCPGCHNPDTIPFTGGREMTVPELVQEIINSITPLTKGITFSGGEPLAQAEGLMEIIKLLKQHNSSLDIWTYTGYTFEEIKHLPVLKMIDVLVDGPFIQEQKDLSLAFRGSANQRLIDVPKTLARGEVVELRLETE
ncbi:anaerobic ribonucleoside-triphosphate reductase activating protein [Desulfohalotomaculum tongense]|uniref:anaerobic ribonucleoside-triphosphate reductase activating protein n=1 Tax=Desulforadius tongensis TaxID=1216062 RepID=UPI00195E8816|nr:anaerobic ribonucleoside-triphosphate reductase activating protein [Desulforadius tongensis]MBM7855231.1 anaerobic ribonucleoside-triphosphate reductase activating protein [Desulforadius tongensis]